LPNLYAKGHLRKVPTVSSQIRKVLSVIVLTTCFKTSISNWCRTISKFALRLPRMRVTTISTAALCSLGVIAAYGVSNKVGGTPQPESPKEEPTVKPSVAPTPEVKVPVAQIIAPPETIAPQPLSITRDLAKERQVREAKLAQDLANVSVPPVSQPKGVKPTGLTEINVPNTSHLPIDRIVAQSVSSVPLPKSLPSVVAAQPPQSPQANRPTPAQPVAQPISAATAPVSAPQRSTSAQPANQPPRTALDAPAAPPQNQPNPTTATATEATAPIATTQPPASQSAPVGTLQQPAVQPQIQPQPQPAQQIRAVLSSVVETVSQPLAQLAVQTTQPAAQPAAQSAVQTTQPAVQPASPPPSPAVAQPAAAPAQERSIQPAVAQPQLAQAAPTGFSAINAASVDETYTLGPGDRISLRFFNTPEYNGEVQVQSDGTLNLPLVGSFSVAGMTLRQAEAEVAARFQSEIRYPVVTVSLLQARPLQVAIVGEVQQPGSYILSLVEGAQLPSIVRAIQAAGGTTQAADLRNVQVQRASRTNPGQTVAVNLVDLLQNGNLSQDLKLRDGDRIIIPTAATVDFAEATQFAASNFAAPPGQAFDIAIVGEVFRPGAYKMGEGGRATVTQAIQLAGGVKPSANVRQIQIRRATRSGTEQVINVDFLQLLQNGNLSQDLALQQGDQITIPTAPASTAAETTLLTAANISPASISVNVVGEVKSPGSVSVPASSTLNQAILAAGGLNNRATREIELIRLEANGTLSRRTIKVDIKQGFNTSENPLLLSNDIIVVGRSGLAQFGDQLNQINSVIGPLLQLIPFRPF
jgi:protein involved in polysaccharide export with SLBB domain